MKKVIFRRYLGALLLVVALLAPSASRLAHASQKGVFTHVETEERIVALTFDDGPHPRYTHAILDLLREYDAKATFFVIGKNLEYYADAARRAVREGHEIGNHTYSHPTLKSLSFAQIKAELIRNKAAIEEALGISVNLFRPPEGSRTRAVEEAAAFCGCPLILWSVDTRDWSGVSAGRIVSEVMEKTVPGSIILFHDYTVGKCHTLEALKEILPRLCAAGYRFVTISELLSNGKAA